MTKQKILNSAIGILGKKGYHESLVDEIARKAGVAKGTVYLYFKSKDELYFSLFERLAAEIRLIISDIAKSKAAPGEKVRLLVRNLCGFFAVHGLTHLMIREQLIPAKGKMREKISKLFRQQFLSINSIVVDAIKSNKVKKYPPKIVSAMIFSSLWAISNLKMRQGRGFDKRSADIVSDILMTGIIKN